MTLRDYAVDITVSDIMRDDIRAGNYVAGDEVCGNIGGSASQ